MSKILLQNFRNYLKKTVEFSSSKTQVSLIKQLSSFFSPFPPRKSTANKMSSGNANPLDEVDDVDIDASGTFKYILIKVWPKDDKTNSKVIARGYRWADFHADIFDTVEPKLLRQKIKCSCPGGGRIKHSPEDKIIEVYGYSQGFGQADHSITVGLLKAKYPDYTSITFSNEGY